MPFLVGIKRSLQPTMEKLPMEAVRVLGGFEA